MRILKIAAICLVLPMMAYYFSACSSAEQTTGKLAYQRGEYQKAETEFMKEVKQNPSNEEAWFYLALSRAQLRNPEGTKEAIEKYRGLKQNSFKSELIDAWYSILQDGEKLFNDGDKLRQAKQEEEAVKKFSESVVRFELAYILLPDSSIAKENIDILNSQINTILLKPLIDKGVEYEKAGNYEAAIGEYNKAKDKVKPGSANYEIVIYDLSLAYLKWGEKMREENSEDPAYKEKYKEAMPYLVDLTKSKEACSQINAYMLLVQVYANLAMETEALDAIAQRDKIKAEHPECENK